MRISIHNNLNQNENTQYNFDDGRYFLSCFGFGVEHDAEIGVVPYCKNTPDKEITCTEDMPISIMLTSVKISCAAHEEHSASDAHDDADAWLILIDIKCMIMSSLKYPEVWYNVTENQEHGSSNSAEPEHNELRVVICSCTDPSVREWLLMLEVLREVVADEYGPCARQECDDGEQCGSELAQKHLQVNNLLIDLSKYTTTTNIKSHIIYLIGFDRRNYDNVTDRSEIYHHFEPSTLDSNACLQMLCIR